MTFVDLDEPQDPKLLRDLGMEAKGTCSLLVATEAEPGMRGTDLRSKIGIMLVVMKPFEHRRMALQASMRVGRRGDKYKLVRLLGVDIVDKEAELEYKSNLYSFMQSQDTQTKNQQKKKPQRSNRSQTKVEVNEAAQHKIEKYMKSSKYFANVTKTATTLKILKQEDEKKK